MPQALGHVVVHRPYPILSVGLNGEKIALEKGKAKALFAALDVEWVRLRTGNQYKELKLSTLTYKRQVGDEGNLICSCAGRK